MYTVNLNEPERYYIRLLLNVKGATSFDHLKTVDNVLYETSKNHAIHRNLFADDKEWEDALEKTESFRMHPQFRQLFAYICIFGASNEPRYIWDKFRLLLIEDYLIKFMEINTKQLAMREIEDILIL
jgi:ATP-dependent DNA helicase PIF1